jgi:two-component system, LytTR family, sensor kinase
MWNFYKNISKSDWLVVAIYWALAYIYIVPAYFVEGRILETFFLSLIEIIARTFLAITIVLLLFHSKRTLKNIIFSLFKISFLFFLLTPLFMIGDGYFDNKKVDWSFSSIAINILSEAQQIGILCTILAMKKYFDIHSYAQTLEKLNIENQLKALNNQVSPHFLFNNLNVLSGLISQNPIQAKEYLNRLALIYRHLIATTHNDIVLLKEELSFADDYIYLLNHRFQNAYEFIKEGIHLNNYDKYLPTCSLQSVLENIIKHNKGDNNNPLKTTIIINEDEIIVTNQKKLKELEFESTGFGLDNLKNRYKLLSNKQLEITVTDETFSVKLPLLNATTYKE